MKKNRYTKQSNRLRTSLKITLGLAAVASSCLAFILILVFNFSKQEQSVAGSPMVFMEAITVQDTSMVYQGSMNQQGIGIVVQTTGEGNPLNFTEMEFAANVSSGNIADLIENARLWYTGSDPEFMCSNQIGNTIPKLVEGKLAITLNKALTPGKNYFWLTFDIKQGFVSPSNLDVSCTKIKLGAIDYLPAVTSPPGNRLVAGNQAYYSVGDLLINHTDSWNSRRDGSGEKPKQMNGERNVYFIQNGHHMQCQKGTSLNTITIENGGTLKAMAAVRLKNMVVETGGIYHQVATVTDFYAFDKFVVANGGTYIHDNTGYLPGISFDFKPHSTQKFLQYGQATFSYTASWGNVIIASTSKINCDIQQYFKHVKGNLEFQMTGLESYLYCDGTDTINIDGNLIFSGGNFTGVTGKNHVLSINIKGDLLVGDGIVTDAQAVGTSQSHTVLNIGGHVNFSGGTFDFAQSLECASEINFIGGESNQVNWIQTGGEVLLGNVRISPEKELNVFGPYFGNLAAKHSFIVERDAALMCGKNQLTGAGRFVLEDKATLGIGHAEGLNSNGLEGNIITGKRVFNSGADYVYYMDMNPQKTGKFDTEPWDGNVRNFTVNKDQQSQWVILSQDFSVTERINIYQGIVEKNSRRLLKSDLSQNDSRKTTVVNGSQK